MDEAADLSARPARPARCFPRGLAAASVALPALLLALAEPAAAQSGAAADPSTGQPAAALAGQAFAFGCLQRLGAAASAAEFARGSDALGAQLAREHPAEAAAVRLDGDGGRGCRVRYAGPQAERMWTAYGRVLDREPPPGQGGCSVVERSDARVRASCTDTATTPARRGELVMERSGGAAGTVTVALDWAPSAG